MTAAAEPLHPRLPMLDRDTAALRSGIIEALNRRRASGLTLVAGLAEDDAADTWIELAAGADRLLVAPLLADGAVPMLADGAGRPDAALAAVALGAIEPLVAAIELVVGRPLRPLALVDAPAPGGTLIRVEAHANDAPVHVLLLAMSANATLAPVGRLPLDPAAAMETCPPWVARLSGPKVPLASLARVTAGDLLLLGTSLGRLRFVPPGRNTVFTGRLDIEGERMVLEDDLGPAGVTLAERQDAIADPAKVSIPTTLEMDGGGLTLDRLATLGVGSVVALPGGGGALPVRLLAGGKAIAEGELVAVGDGYGMLVTAVGPDRAREA